MHMNHLAVVNQSPRIEVQDSLTAFVRRVLNLDPKGRNITEVKTQLARLSASDNASALVRIIHLGLAPRPGQDICAVDVKSLNVWFPKNENQRVLWPSVIELSPEYFNALMLHAVPLRRGVISPPCPTARWLSTFTHGWRSVYTGSRQTNRHFVSVDQRFMDSSGRGIPAIRGVRFRSGLSEWR